MTEATQRPLAGAWWQDPNDNRIHDAEGNDVLDHMTVTEIGRRVNNHDALVAMCSITSCFNNADTWITRTISLLGERLSATMPVCERHLDGERP